MHPILQVALGGALGAVLRFGVVSMCPRLFGPTFPHGTLIVNVMGSFLMGVAIAWFAARAPAVWAMPFVTIGLLGGFTTFSAFSLDTVALFEQGRSSAALLYVSLSVTLSVAGLLAGAAIARASLS